MDLSILQRRCVAYLMALALLPFHLSAASESAAPLGPTVVIIAHKGVPSKQLSRSEMQNVFLGKSTKWDGGPPIVLVNLRGGEIHEAFARDYTNKSPSQYKTYWKKRVFTGKGKTPRTASSESRLVDFVARTPGAIGYISQETANDPKIINDPKTKQQRIRQLVRKGS